MKKYSSQRRKLDETKRNNENRNRREFSTFSSTKNAESTRATISLFIYADLGRQIRGDNAVGKFWHQVQRGFSKQVGGEDTGTHRRRVWITRVQRAGK